MRRSRLIAIHTVLALLPATAASAQQAAQSSAPTMAARFGMDSVASADTFVEHEGAEGGAAFDLMGGWQLGPAVQIVARPVLRRDHEGDWSADLYQLALRHDRGRRVRMRLETGYLPSPIGISPLEARADNNPLVAPITSYTASLPAFEAGTPQTQLASPLYPLAVQATWSTSRWDLRASVLESSLVRVRPLTGDDKPPRAPQIALGGGLTPRIGLRLGASLAYGRYASRNEVADASAGHRTASILSVDGDYAFGHTRIYGDMVYTSLERAADHAVASALTVTAVQTLTPRWYVAGRAQRLTTSNLLHSYYGEPYPYGEPGGGIPQAGYDDHGAYNSSPAAALDPAVLQWQDLGAADALTIETGAGYRLSPALTLRATYLGYRGFDDDAIEHHGTFSIVWTRRWF